MSGRRVRNSGRPAAAAHPRSGFPGVRVEERTIHQELRTGEGP